MFSTQNQMDLGEELKTLHGDEGSEYTAGYLTTMVVEMLNMLPKRKQKEFIAQVAQKNGNKMVKVVSLMNGDEIEIRRADKNTCCDPSQERYWSM